VQKPQSSHGGLCKTDTQKHKGRKAAENVRNVETSSNKELNCVSDTTWGLRMFSL